MKPVTLFLLQSLWCIAISGLPLESDKSSHIISSTPLQIRDKAESASKVVAPGELDFKVLSEGDPKTKAFTEKDIRNYAAFPVRLLQRLFYDNANRHNRIGWKD